MNRLIAATVTLVCMALAGHAVPLDGQIVRDPGNPARLVYHNTYVTINGERRLKPCFFAGPGDPEDFFHNGTSGNLTMLKSKGARCTYVTAYLTDFGGGTPTLGDLDSWNNYISEMQSAGIITVFFFFDDSYARPSNWQDMVGAMVDKFKEHRLLVWSVAEEFGEALTATQVSEVAAFIKQRDDRGHVVAVHQNSGTSFSFNGNASLDMFALQYNVTSASAVHSGMLSAWSNTGGNKILNLAEIADHAKQSRAVVRQWNWAAAMGGVSAVQVLWMGRATDDPTWNADGKYTDCAALMDFMEKTDVNDMAPHDELKAGGTQWVLAAPGASYIAYAQSLSGNIGITGMTAGVYSLLWLDIATRSERASTVTIAAGTNTFMRPSGIGAELAVWIARAGTTESPVLSAVVVSPDTARILVSESATFSAAGRDQYGRTVAETFTWRVGGGGSMSGAVFTAGNVAGAYVVSATAASNSSISGTAVVLVSREYAAPVARDATLNVPQSGSSSISLPYTCASPGPFTFAVTLQPSHGTLSADGNDVTYVAAAGYSGTDSFKWRATDTSNGKVSNEATVSVGVMSAAQTCPNGWYYVVQAEDFTSRSGSGWTELASRSGYTGSGYMQASGSQWSSVMHYEVDFPAAGTYYVYFRTWAANSESNGLHLMLDGTRLTGVIGVDGIYFVKTSRWNWSGQWQLGESSHTGPVDITIGTAGKHTITVANRDQGAELDKIAVLDRNIQTYTSTGTVTLWETALNPLPDGYCSATAVDIDASENGESFVPGSTAALSVNGSSVAVSAPQPGRLDVLTLQGKHVRRVEVRPGVTTVGVEELALGTYVLRLCSGEVILARPFVASHPGH